jgi:hypothetical protein
VFEVGGEVDPQPSCVASPGEEVAPLSPVVDDVGFDAEPGGDLGDAQLRVTPGFGAGGVVLVGGFRPRLQTDPPGTEGDEAV